MRIILVFVGGAVVFGLVHDQVTARVCLEYFTIAHVQLIQSESPTVLGVVWGVVATWWAGALAGILVGAAAREGPWPKLGWRYYVGPVIYLGLAMAAISLVAGGLGYLLTTRGAVRIVSSYADAIAPERQARFMADVLAHAASYAVGLAGALVIAGWSIHTRRRVV